MSRSFIFIKKDGSPSKSVGFNALYLVAAVRVRAATGPFRIVQNGRFGVPRLRADALKYFRKDVQRLGVGDSVRIQDGTGAFVFKEHEVTAPLTISDISGNDHADLYYSRIMAKFPQYHPRYAGSYVCKDVLGTSTPSQHSYGNAVDFFFDTLDDQDKVAAWVVLNASGLNICHAISRDRIWTIGVGWGDYGGEYHSHLHCDFVPQFSGACGVREP